MGNLYESPDIDCWEQSASTYHQLALAMRERNFAYLEIQSLKNLFDIHSNQQYLYGESKKQTQAGFEILQLSHLKEMLRKANVSVTDEILKNALTQMNNDHLLKITAPLYLFFAIKNGDAHYTAQDFRTALKINIQHFPTQKQPKQIKCAIQDCSLFYTLLNAVWWNPDVSLQPDALLFDPFALLMRLRKDITPEISDSTLAEIANLCLTCFAQPSVKKELVKFPFTIHNQPLGEILKAFFDVFAAQAYETGKTGGIHPRDFEKSLRLLYQAKRIEELPEISYHADKYTPAEYEQIKHAVLTEYAASTYAFNLEAFWLITGYIPPVNCLHTDTNKTDFYSLVYRLLCSAWNDCTEEYCADISKSEYLSCSQTLRNDILKVRSLIASKCDGDIVSTFLEELQKNYILPQPMPTQKMLEFCLSQYQKIQTSKTKFKSFDYAADMLSNEIMAELCIQTGIYLYQKIFSLLASFNKYLWPI